MRSKALRTLTAAVLVISAASAVSAAASAFSSDDIRNGNELVASGSWVTNEDDAVIMTDEDNDGVWEGSLRIDNVQSDMLIGGNLEFIVALNGEPYYSWGNYNSETKTTLGGDAVCVPAEAGRPLDMKVELNTRMKSFYYTDKSYEELGEDAYTLWPVFYTKLISELSLNSSTLNLKVNDTAALAASYYPTDARNTGLTWKSSDTSVVTVSSNGTVTAKGAGTADVTVSSDNGKQASCRVTVTDTMPTSVKLSQTSAVMDKGKTLRLSATVQPAAANPSLTWTSSSPTVASVDQNGVVTAKSAGKAVITVKTVNGLTSTCTINIYGEPTGIKLDKTSLTLKKNDRYTFKPTLSGVNPKSALKWTSSDSSVVSVSTSGAIYAHKGGKATIKVTTANNLTASCTVTVKVDSTGVKLNKTNLTMGVGDKFTLKGTISPSDATDKKLTWSTSDKKIVTVSGGKLTAKKAGTAKITVKTSNGKKTTCKVTVKKQPTKLTLNKTSMNLELDKTATLKLTLTPSNAYKNVTWSTSDKKIVTVKDGKLTPKKTGTATITVKSSNGKKATCKVTVKKPDYIKRLKNTISKSSKKDSDGNRYITLSDSSGNTSFTTRITYNKKKDKLNVNVFMSTKNSGINNLDVTVKFDIGSKISPKVYYSHTYTPYFKFESKTSSKLKISDFTKSSNPSWNITKTTGIGYLSESDRKDFCTASSYLLHTAIYTLDYTTEERAGITIQQLGFKKYIINGKSPILS